MMTECEFIRATLGTRNWVVSVRCPRIVARYGEDVVCVSQKRYAKIMQDYAAHVENETVAEIAASAGLPETAFDALRQAYRAGRSRY